MKILMLLNALLSFIYSPVYEDDDYEIKIEEVEDIKNDIVKVKNNVCEFYFNQNYLFSINNSSYDYLEIDKNLYIGYIENDYLVLKIYDDSAKLLKTIIINDKSFNNTRIKLIKVNDKIYLFSTIINNEEDIYILELDVKLNILKDKSLGGKLKDEFSDVIYTNDTFYLVLAHDPLSKGDFEYGGNYIISKLNLDLDVMKSQIVNENKYLNMKFDNTLKIVFQSCEYELDEDLNLIFSFIYHCDSIYTSIASDDCRLSFYPDRMEFYYYDYDSVNEVNTQNIFKTFHFNYDNKYLKEVFVFDDCFYMIFTDDYLDYMYKMQIYNTKDFVKHIVYIDGISEYNTHISNWFRDIKLEIIENNLNTEVNGTYEIKYGYKDFEKSMVVEVLEEENVVEGMIYPLSYKLYFTGTAFLNNKMIYNNYSINEEGNYTLDLYSNKKEKRTINFQISKSQIDFQNYICKKSDFSAKRNQNITIIYDAPDELEDVEIIIDGYKYQNYQYDGNVLKINFSFDDIGFYKRRIDSINGIIINDIITFNIYDDDPNIIFNLKENRKDIEINVENECGNIRLFNLYLDNNLYKSYPIGDVNIILPYEKNYNQIKVMIAYEPSTNKIYEKELFMTVLDDIHNSDFINIEITKKEEMVDEYKLSLNNKDKIEMIKNEEKIIYQKQENNDNTEDIVIIILGCMNICVVLYYFFNRLKRKKKSIE